MVERLSLSLRDQLISVCTAYAEATGISLSTLSTQVLNGGGRLQAIVSGGDLNTRSFEKAMIWFAAGWPPSVDWPAEVKWPEEVKRPTRPQVAAVGEGAPA